MRSFEDDDGRRWQVAVGRESYGSMVILFSRGDSDKVLRHPLTATGWRHGETELSKLGDDELRALLREALPWDSGPVSDDKP